MDISDASNPVLIVDDNVQYVQVLTMMLKGVFGYKDITSVNSLEQGFSQVSTTPDKFKLIFVDFRFPSGGTGVELLQKLSREKLLDGKVSFLITSEPSVDNVKAAQAAGAIGLVAKPFDRQELQRQLEKAKRLLEVSQGDSF